MCRKTGGGFGVVVIVAADEERSLVRPLREMTAALKPGERRPSRRDALLNFCQKTFLAVQHPFLSLSSHLRTWMAMGNKVELSLLFQLDLMLESMYHLK